MTNRAYAWYVVAILSLCNALSYLDRQVLSIMVNPIQRDLGFSDTEMGILLGPAFILLFASAGMPMGRLADTSNRARLLCAGILIWSTGTFVMGLARDYPVMLGGRIAIGLGEAVVVPASFSLVSEYFAPHQRGRATGLVTMGIAIGAGMALLGGGLLMRALEPVGGTSLPLIGPRAPWAMVLMTFGLLGAIVAALVLTVIDPRRKPEVATGAPIATPAFGRFLKTHPRALTFVLLPYILLSYMQTAMIPWVPTLLTRRYALVPSDAATLYGSITLTIALFAAVAGGFVADRLVRWRPEGPFLLVTVLTPFFLPGTLLFTLGSSPLFAVVGLCTITIVGGFCSTTVYAAVQNVVPPQFRGRILALYAMLAQLIGLGLGPFAVGLLTDHVFHDRAMLPMAMIVAVGPAWCVTLFCGIVGIRHFAHLRAHAAGE